MVDAAAIPTTAERTVVHRPVVVMPTYNEAENLPGMLESVLGALSTDIIVVDDSSPDGTGAIAEQFADRTSRVQLLSRPAKSGLASAYIDGFRLALDRGYDVVFQMDADGSHEPVALETMLLALADADLVIGSRWVAGGGVERWPWYRKLVSRGGSAYSRFLLRMPVRDCTGGFKCWRADILREVLASEVGANGYVFQVEMTYRALRRGARVVEVPIRFGDRTAGESKFNSGIVAEAMLRVLSLRARTLVQRKA